MAIFLGYPNLYMALATVTPYFCSTPSVQGLPWAFWVSLSLELTMGTSSSVSRRMERMASQVASWSGRGGRRCFCLMLGLKMPGFCGAQLFGNARGWCKKNQPKSPRPVWKMGSIQTPSAKAERNNYWRWPSLETHLASCATCNGANSGLIWATCVLKIMGRK